MRKKRFFVVAAIVVILVLLNLPVSVSLRVKCGSRDTVAPLQRFIHYLADRSRAAFRPFVDAKRALEEKRKMQENLASLSFQVQNLKACEHENEELRKLLAFKSQQKRKLVMCEVMARGGASGWWQTLRLDKGKKHGLAPDLAVITAEGVIGRTGGVGDGGQSANLKIGELTSDVLLIIDPNCKVACQFTRSGAFGIVRGMGVSASGDAKLEMLCGVRPCRMDYISKTEEILPGDEVRTSGLGGVFPEGLLVGHVTKVEMDQSGLYQRAEVLPAARLDEIRYAFVVAPDTGVGGRVEDAGPAKGAGTAGEEGRNAGGSGGPNGPTGLRNGEGGRSP